MAKIYLYVSAEMKDSAGSSQNNRAIRTDEVKTRTVFPPFKNTHSPHTNTHKICNNMNVTGVGSSFPCPGLGCNVELPWNSAQWL